MTVYAEKRAGRLTGVYIIEVDGQRRRSRDISEARTIEAAMRAGDAPDMPAKSVPPVYTLGHLQRDSRVRFSGQRSAALTEMRFDTCVQLLGEDTPLADIRRAKLRELAKALKKRKGRDGKSLSGSTVNRYLAAISGALKWAVDEEVMGEDYTQPSVPRYEEGESRTDVVAVEDEARIVAHLEDTGHHRLALCVEVLAATGMRANELCLLERPDLALGNADDTMSWITVRKEVAKSKKPRTVPLPTPLAKRLVAVMEVEGLPRYWQLFRLYKAACAALGLPETVGLHTLRHTAGTRLGAVVSLSTVQDFLGHADPRTTKGYVHTQSDTLAEAARLLQASRQSQGAAA